MHRQNRYISAFRIVGGPVTATRGRPVEFHVRSDVRRRYDFDDAFFSITGNVIFADFQAVLQFCDRFNSDPDDPLKLSPADVNAAALMDELLHFAILRYRTTVDPDVIERALSELDDEHGAPAVNRILTDFLKVFPTTEVFRSRTTASDYLAGMTGNISNRELALEELLISRLSNENPAYRSVEALIRDDELRSDPLYPAIVTALSKPPPAIPGRAQPRESLVDMLRRPSRHAPYSLAAQLAFARDEWDVQLAPFVTERVTMGLGLLIESERSLERMGFTGGPGPVRPPEFGLEPEEENFSPDVDWMPHVIMVAKNALVWLDQMTKKYGRPIRHLDEVPEEEVSQLARWGFNALWLIGIWQRSEASRTLKQWTGNPEAAPSAYSLFDYIVADELGGEPAVERFGEMCRRHGIRLASDMVPNHSGIDSRWVREHPDWFIQLPHAPYPSYRYSGESVGAPEAPLIQIEDGYFDRSDAAVTFKLTDRSSGRERFIYHGNDGTGMPWNDTAQLDFTNPEVREAVTQTILHVARLFPIIRFDAAMVLTKKHFHRLWYPEPGSGEGIPSRAAYGMNRADFDKKMPNEFWREVVDRVAEEVPDTLLLAEAFWLLEGYFVRTLGMHRVYNSAFMHMLKKEDNAEYRDVIKKTVAFEPEVLKRYVNFMSNPDEETALEQFGDGDKYFGVCTLMQTLPGLPMYGHGQVEGLREKYGMEYRRAYLDESTRIDLVARHEREIAPVARKRYLFSEVTFFRLFDFETAEHGIDENVYAFSNGIASERVLVLYNNRYQSTKGNVRNYALGGSDRSGPSGLVEALGLDLQSGDLVQCRDLITGLYYLDTVKRLSRRGLKARLRGYERRVLIDFKVLRDDGDGMLTRLAEQLDGVGVPDLTEAKREIHLSPLVSAVAPVVHAALSGHSQPEPDTTDLAARDRFDIEPDRLANLFDEIYTDLSTLLDLSLIAEKHPWRRSSRYRAATELIAQSLHPGAPVRAILLAKHLLGALEELDARDAAGIVEGVLVRLGLTEGASTKTALRLALAVGGLEESPASDRRPIERFVPIVESNAVEEALNVHEFDDTLYFSKELLETFSTAAFCEGALIECEAALPDTARHVAKHYDAHRRLMRLAAESDYDWTALRKRIKRIRRSKERLPADDK